MYSILLKDEGGKEHYARTTAGVLRQFSTESRAESFIDKHIDLANYALVDIVDRPELKRGRLKQSIVNDDDRDYICRYLAKRYSEWFTNFSALSNQAINILVLEHLNDTQINTLRATIRKNRQLSREASLRFPPASVKLSGEAQIVIERFLSRSNFEDSASDIICRFLDPIAKLSSSEQERLLTELNHHHGNSW